MNCWHETLHCVQLRNTEAYGRFFMLITSVQLILSCAQRSSVYLMRNDKGTSSEKKLDCGNISCIAFAL